MLHIKFKETGAKSTTQAVLAHILGPWGWDKRSKHVFLKVVMLPIKLKGMEQRAPRKLSLHTYLAPGVRSKGPKHFFSERSNVAYQIKGHGG